MSELMCLLFKVISSANDIFDINIRLSDIFKERVPPTESSGPGSLQGLALHSFRTVLTCP